MKKTVTVESTSELIDEKIKELGDSPRFSKIKMKYAFS